MKKRFGFIAIGLFIIASSNVHAASSVDLRVTGSITPSACVPQLSSGGLIDYGKISVKDLRWDKVMPVQRLQLSVNCDAATFFAIKSTDNRSGTAHNNSSSAFGLGLGVNDHKLGMYNLTMENALADGAVARLVESVDSSTWFPVSEGQVWQPKWMRTANASGPDFAPVAMQTFEADMVVATTIAQLRNLAAEVSLDGSATLDIVYL